MSSGLGKRPRDVDNAPEINVVLYVEQITDDGGPRVLSARAFEMMMVN